MSEAVILVEIDTTSPAGVTQTLRFSDRSIRPWPPSDPDRANLVWQDRMGEAPAMRRQLVDDLTTLEPGWGVGTVTLLNGDGALDAYQAHTWGKVSVRLADRDAPFAASRVLFAGVCATPVFGISSSRPSRVTVAFYDHRADLDEPTQTVLYAGGNGVGGVLYEGVAGGIKGRAKPLAYGLLLDAHLPAPCVNSAVLAHQLHIGPVAGDEQIFDRGAPAGFVDDGDAAGAAFDAANPSAAHYKTDLSRGLLKINGDPVGGLTFGLKGDAAGGYVQTAGPIASRLLTRGGVPAGRIGASIAALPTAAPIGVWSDDGRPLRDLLAWIAKGALAALLPDRLGVWQAYPIAPPALVADMTLNPLDVISLDAEVNAPPPAGVIKVGWGRIWTTFRGTDLAAALRETEAGERLAAEYRWVTVEDAQVKARLPGAWRTLEFETPLRLEADAQVLAASLKALFGLRPDGRPRRAWKVRLPRTNAVLDAQLGQTIALTYPRLSIDDRFLLIGEEPLRPNREQVTWTLWG